MVHKAYLATEWHNTRGPTKLAAASVEGKDLRELLHFFPTAKATIYIIVELQVQKAQENKQIKREREGPNTSGLSHSPPSKRTRSITRSVKKQEKKEIKKEEPETGGDSELSSVPSSSEELSDEEGMLVTIVPDHPKYQLVTEGTLGLAAGFH